MLKIFLLDLHQNKIWTKWRTSLWMSLYLMVTGTHCLVTVHQPPLITAALGHNVVMPCHLKLSHNEKLVTSPVLYWVPLKQQAHMERLWSPSSNYKGRVHLVDENPNSFNKSIRLKNVQWEDDGKYLCKLSITTENDRGSRKMGNVTSLRIYDTMTFNITSRDDSLLRCEVNVSRESGFALSVFHDGHKRQSVDSAPRGPEAALPYVTLSETLSLRADGLYECQLGLDNHLIAKSIYHHQSPGLVQFPEPWLLYLALLLVPVSFLLVMVTALLTCRNCL